MPKNNEVLHILFASRLVLEKGADILIESIKKTLNSDSIHQRVIWHICSTGPYKDQIIHLQNKNPWRVFYHSSLSQAWLAWLYREADILFMPSRFLETFWLTALESLSCGTPVIWFAKGGLTPFIPESLSLETDRPVDSFMDIISSFSRRKDPIDVSRYNTTAWGQQLQMLFSSQKSLCLFHDYYETIWGAEYYVWKVESFLKLHSYRVSRYGYRGKTTPLRRKILFITSLWTFWKSWKVKHLLEENRVEAIWMHSILRYIGYWWVNSAMHYAQRHNARVYLSHHDLGLLVAFPQDITDESQIPTDPSLRSFIRNLSGRKKFVGFFKWGYIFLIKKALTSHIEHIIFSSFLEKHIQNHFPGQKIHIFPHSYDEAIFHK